jgi:hypothetical protein
VLNVTFSPLFWAPQCHFILFFQVNVSPNPASPTPFRRNSPNLVRGHGVHTRRRWPRRHGHQRAHPHVELPETVAVWRNPMPDIFWRPLRIFSSISIFSLCATCVFSLFFQLKKYYFFFWYHFKSHNVETILASDFFSTKYFFVFFSSRDFVILKANPQPMSKESTITIRHERSNTVQSDPQPRSRLSKLRLRFEIYWDQNLSSQINWAYKNVSWLMTNDRYELSDTSNGDQRFRLVWRLQRLSPLVKTVSSTDICRLVATTCRMVHAQYHTYKASLCSFTCNSKLQQKKWTSLLPFKTKKSRVLYFV